MKITVIGAGYVGLITGISFAELGNDVWCLDVDKTKIAQLTDGIPPFYEPGLAELLERNIQAKRLHFSTQPTSIATSEVVFIAVGTPSLPHGDVNLSYVEQSATTIGEHLTAYTVIVNKSTVPVGTGDFVTEIINKHYSGPFDVVSNPEFLREGSAIADSMKPERIVVGGSSPKAMALMQELYKPFDCPILCTDIKTAEIIKYASNAFLATSISFINQISQLCTKVGADVQAVAQGMKLDKRIGKYAFLSAGIGYGGSCFPKDVKGLMQSLRDFHCSHGLLEAVEHINQSQIKLFLDTIHECFPSRRKTTLAVWGLAFKPKTDDMRDAPSLPILQHLLDEGFTIQAYDPEAMENAKKLLPTVTYCENALDTLVDADGLLVLTEWDEFRQINMPEVKSRLNTPILIDGRNIYDSDELTKLGITYKSIGR